MAIRFEITDNILIFTTIGEVDFKEGLTVLQNGLKTYADSQPTVPRIIFDIAQSSENRSADELKGIAAVVCQYVHRARIVMVVRSNLHYGLSRMFSAYVSQKNEVIHIVRDLAEAYAWFKAYKK